MTADINTFLREAAERDASDLYLKAGNRPFLRVDGQLAPLAGSPLTVEDLVAITRHLLGEERQRQFTQFHEQNFAFEADGVGRFRANALYQRGRPALIIRRIRQRVPTFQELNLPTEVLRRFAEESRGLILFTGTTGSGKSTTVASWLDYINQHYAKHIVTLEDPIEFVFAEQQSVINQREVGLDTPSFSEGLKHVLRQSPDVLYVSDLRDQETVTSAINGAEAGLLVVACLHTLNATNTIERLVNFFPPHQHAEVRLLLSMVLRGVMSLRLIPRQSGGRVPACEVMVVTPTIRELIKEDRTDHMPPFLQEGALFGMQTFHQALVHLYRNGQITLENARRFADSRDELELALKDVQGFRSGASIS